MFLKWFICTIHLIKCNHILEKNTTKIVVHIYLDQLIIIKRLLYNIQMQNPSIYIKEIYQLKYNLFFA